MGRTKMSYEQTRKKLTRVNREALRLRKENQKISEDFLKLQLQLLEDQNSKGINILFPLLILLVITVIGLTVYKSLLF